MHVHGKDLRRCGHAGVRKDTFTFYPFVCATVIKASLLVFRIVKDTSSNTIQILLSHPGHTSSTILARFRNLHLLQLNQHAPDDTGVGLAKVFRTGTPAVVSSVPLSELSHSDSRTEVDLARDGGGADVVPVLSVGGEFVGDGGLDEIGPDGEFEFIRVLEMFGVGGDECLGGYVADADSSCFFGHGWIYCFLNATVPVECVL
mmetsp:Transcript_19668/g.42774  ORF Transcript_19668/g.42774 Transcript_19668/m.42774 type:complete len:203 (-) Transcript_19668:74-682(-)